MSKKLKECKHCGKEIAKDVVKCIHCGGKNKKSLLQNKFVLGYLFAASFVLLFATMNRSKDSAKLKVLDVDAINAQEKAKKSKNTPKPRVIDKKKVKDCNDIYTAFAATIKSGASVQVISKGASTLYDKIRSTTSECKYIRYAFRTLRKPYEGDKVSPRDWDKAINNFLMKREY